MLRIISASTKLYLLATVKPYIFEGEAARSSAARLSAGIFMMISDDNGNKPRNKIRIVIKVLISLAIKLLYFGVRNNIVVLYRNILIDDIVNIGIVDIIAIERRAVYMNYRAVAKLYMRF